MAVRLNPTPVRARGLAATFGLPFHQGLYIGHFERWFCVKLWLQLISLAGCQAWLFRMPQ